MSALQIYRSEFILFTKLLFNTLTNLNTQTYYVQQLHENQHH